MRRGVSPGTLYIVSTPIGHPDDISFRALSVLKEADLVVCEELKEGRRLLRRYGISRPLLDLNEHNEETRTPELVARLARGESIALFSDAGTPLLTDPGRGLVEEAYRVGARVKAIPGPSALLAALVVSGLPMERFRFLGYLPAKKEERRLALRSLRKDPDTLVFFDAPYRLLPLLEDLAEIFGPSRFIVVACDLTMPTEKVVRGKARDVLNHFKKNPFKGEFVVVVEGRLKAQISAKGR
jgi:16S rRNA (cytidine1402-2'-O)-methyltransferase